mgnify:CR=1 FL=1
MKGQLVVISGPTAVGKGTLVHELVKRNEDYLVSISCTTRAIRSNEVDGRDYFFVSKEEFETMIENNELLEYANVHGEYYGTPKKFVLDKIKDNKTVILEIDVQGGLQVHEKYPLSSLIFVLPPTFKDLEKRIRHRGTETNEQIKRRLETARRELKILDKYDYVVVNDDFERCLKDLEIIIEANKFKVDIEKYVSFKEEISND